ncbi:maleylpyruvate isomerase N-terminal domain-containing protein [Saxibacter everestensis]|uniref:Maleylpyruvate isomerase N-terminal domain-containing protein n=1 Tax=Saxibacter everestensis TaxID=2909229 RepID=A0ABY8QQY6_9MICO|nr:maleylpyruvate isomerase N-terminal domain-containing protein [Brevibacteriaceae bacterium ZFBP1038]
MSHPGLGEWNIRDLAGHTSRSLITVETYLAVPMTSDPPTLRDPVAYYRATAATLAGAAAVVERGRQAGRDLGPDPVQTVQRLVDRVIAIVRDSPDDSILTTPFGTIGLLDYLPTRTFELTVHSLDLIRAAAVALPSQLDGAIDASLQLAARMAYESERGVPALLALTGRQQLPEGFSVV